jgi:small GTP-binding protein
MNNDIEILPQNSIDNPDITFKIIMIGNSGVGKTCLALRAGTGNFHSSTTPTIGFEILNLDIKYLDKIIRLQIWDTCGQETYKSIISKFYKQAKLCLLVFSIDDRKSFNDLDSWYNELKENGDEDVKIALVGNKTDLENREVTKEEELDYKTIRNLDLCFESSAKHGDNSKDIFIEGAKLIYNDYLKKKKEEKKIEKVKEGKNKKNSKLNKTSDSFKIKKRKIKKNKKNIDEDYDYDEYDYDDGKGTHGSCNKKGC